MSLLADSEASRARRARARRRAPAPRRPAPRRRSRGDARSPAQRCARSARRGPTRCDARSTRDGAGGGAGGRRRRRASACRPAARIAPIVPHDVEPAHRLLELGAVRVRSGDPARARPPSARPRAFSRPHGSSSRRGSLMLFAHVSAALRSGRRSACLASAPTARGRSNANQWCERARIAHDRQSVTPSRVGSAISTFCERAFGSRASKPAASATVKELAPRKSRTAI